MKQPSFNSQIRHKSPYFQNPVLISTPSLSQTWMMLSAAHQYLVFFKFLVLDPGHRTIHCCCNYWHVHVCCGGDCSVRAGTPPERRELLWSSCFKRALQHRKGCVRTLCRAHCRTLCSPFSSTLLTLEKPVIKKEGRECS